MIQSNLQKEDRSKVGFYVLMNFNAGLLYSGSGNLGECEYRHQQGYTKNNHNNNNLRDAFQKHSEGWEFLAMPVEEPGFSRRENRELAFDLEQSDIDEYYGNPGF
ncbi:MAG: hypothetical protein ACD_84C00042G0009 [uncultured bacterium]|nr:MAG: hypothetical protein ACD_84C00042G0009 [uncultured bacterium]